jgi:hypothetical protein
MFAPVVAAAELRLLALAAAGAGNSIVPSHHSGPRPQGTGVYFNNREVTGKVHPSQAREIGRFVAKVQSFPGGQPLPLPPKLKIGPPSMKPCVSLPVPAKQDDPPVADEETDNSHDNKRAGEEYNEGEEKQSERPLKKRPRYDDSRNSTSKDKALHNQD